jgi:6-phosphofructokinase 1
LTAVIDKEEAIQLGEEAVSLALAGEDGKMVCVERLSSDPYLTRLTAIPVEQVINGGHLLPLSYINNDENFIDDSFLDYIRPLIGYLPTYSRLSFEKVLENNN